MWRLPGIIDRADRLLPQLAAGRPLPAIAVRPMPQQVQRPPLPPLSAPPPPVLLASARPVRAARPALLQLPLPMARLQPQAAAALPAPFPALAPGAPSPATAPPAIAPHAPAMPAPAAVAPTAFSLASLAYDRLRSRRRRDAAALFDAALSLEPGNRQWRQDRRALGRHWQAEAFALVRESPASRFNAPGAGLPGAAASPVLGGGQAGASLAFVPDPLARRPIAAVARVVAAVDPVGGLDRQSAQAALGVRLGLLPGLSVTAERLQPLAGGRGQFTLRLAGGGRVGRFDGYGEAGVLERGDIYAGGQATARVLNVGPATLAAGAWGSVQTGATQAGTSTVWRVDVGPQVMVPVGRLRLAADWRQRVAGNAAPGSGPVLTVSAGF
jgi:hypothetical protein